MIERGLWNINRDIEESWNTMASCIRNIGKKVFGEAKSGWSKQTETWQWYDEVQYAM